jgi:chromosomal replication initiator protein
MKTTIKTIIKPYLNLFGVTESQVLSLSRKRNIAYCRFICINAVRENTALTLEEIGDYFGGRCHSAIHHAILKAEELASDPKIKTILK